MKLIHDVLPDPARPDVHAVMVGEWTVPASRQRATLEAVTAGWERAPWPGGVISRACYAGTDGEAVLTYEQRAGETPLRGPIRAGGTAGIGTGPAEPAEYRLYRSAARKDAPEPGCIVIVSVEFDGPDEQRQKRWIDAVFDALEAEEAPHPGGISGHFHFSTDGTRVLNYAEWTDERAHREALEHSGRGTVGVAPEWRRVMDFPGVRNSGFRRYRLHRSLATPPK